MDPLSNKYLAITGRIKAFQTSVTNSKDATKNVLPTSCTLYVYDNNLPELLNFTSAALKRGAGVKIVLEEFNSFPPSRDIPSWFFVYQGVDEPLTEKLPTYLKHMRRIDYDVCYPKNSLTDLASLKNLFQSPLRAIPDIGKKAYKVIKVADTLEPEGFLLSIQESWKIFDECLAKGVIPIVDLSALRPNQTLSSNTLIATGAFGDGSGEGSFVEIYEWIWRHRRLGTIISLMQLLGKMNSTIRKGRKEKTGIVCTSLHYTHPEIEEYLKFPTSLLTGSQKKAIRMDAGILQKPDLIDLVIQANNKESLFLEKTDRENEDPTVGKLYNQVCEEILLPHRGTCLLSHVNGGQLARPSDIPKALVSVSKFLCETWDSWRNLANPGKLYLPKDKDRQIGVGWIGLNNALATWGITQSELAVALEVFLDRMENLPKNEKLKDTPEALEVAKYLHLGYMKAANVGKKYGIKRMFTLAPTQSIAFEYSDLQGNTCSKSIDPPQARRVKRFSERTGEKFYTYGKQNTIADVGAETHEHLWNQWQRLINHTGKAHTLSYDLWTTIDEEWLRWFLNDPNPKADGSFRKPCYLQTTYYNLAYSLDQSFLNKGRSLTAVDSLEDTEKAVCSIEDPEGCSACNE
jgi:hypothetical protein